MAGNKESESEIMTAITAFEQILEAMPNDRASLEALSHAYEQIGDMTRSKDYMIRLTEVVLEEEDVPAAKELLTRLNQYTDEDPRAKELAVIIVKQADECDLSAAGVPSATASEQPSKAVDVAVSEFNMADELSFAWSLMENNQLSQDEYSQVVQNLTEMSTSEGTSTISVLHVLEAMGFSGIERVLQHISSASDAPIVSLLSYDMQLDSVKALPFAFMRSRGAMIYDMLSGDALAVVMNPLDEKLLKDIEKLANRRCHFYTCLPQEFDKAMEKAEELLDAEAEAQAELG